MEIMADKDLRTAYYSLKGVVDKWLKKSAYSEVNLDKLFEMLVFK